MGAYLDGVLHCFSFGVMCEVEVESESESIGGRWSASFEQEADGFSWCTLLQMFIVLCLLRVHPVGERVGD